VIYFFEEAVNAVRKYIHNKKYKNMSNENKKINIDVWSDIMCPFCYIGKRKLEKALAQFEHKDDVAITWHSFQLDPTIQYEPGRDFYQYLADRKGQSRDWSVKIHKQMEQNAKDEGLDYHFDKAVIANSFNAHRLIHMAKTKGLGDAAKEQLLKAYFTDGRNVDDMDTLVDIGASVGLDADEVRRALSTDSFAQEVQADIATAGELGINGVPFFLFNQRYAISGAQPTELFLSGLRQLWAEQLQEEGHADYAVCTPGGDC